MEFASESAPNARKLQDIASPTLSRAAACKRELRSVLPQSTSVRKPSSERMLLFATAAGCTGHGNMARSTLSMWAMKAPSSRNSPRT